VRVRQVDQAEVREDRLGQVDDDIARLIPGGEDTDLRLALRADGAVEEADSRMPAAGIGKHEERGAAGPFRAALRRDVVLPQRSGDRGRLQPGCGADFRGGEPVIPDHVLEPVPQVGLVARQAGLGNPQRQGNEQRGDSDHRGRSP
jgi:hypothetical protein